MHLEYREICLLASRDLEGKAVEFGQRSYNDKESDNEELQPKDDRVRVGRDAATTQGRKVTELSFGT